MYGLTMIKQYLDEILDGEKTFDARSYPTNKRGTIALVDSRTMKVYGTVELVGCKEISAREYCDWHAIGKWKGLVLEVQDMNASYFAYDFKEPKRLENPLKLDCEKHTWVKVSDGIEMHYQEALF